MSQTENAVTSSSGQNEHTERGIRFLMQRNKDYQWPVKELRSKEVKVFLEPSIRPCSCKCVMKMA